MRYAKTILLECLLISVIGLVIGLIANAVYSDGVELGHDYFRKITIASASQPTTQDSPAITTTKPDGKSNDQNASNVAAVTPVNDEVDPLAEVVSNLEAKGHQVIQHDEVEAFYQDPYYQDGSYIIIDARDDAHYQAGHIPGAYQLDHYRFKKYIDEVLPVCQTAEKIVVYCNGGDCEDSEFATVYLMDQGVDFGKLFIYPGGMTLWKQKDLPTERGERNSGDIVNGLSLPGDEYD